MQMNFRHRHYRHGVQNTDKIKTLRKDYRQSYRHYVKIIDIRTKITDITLN